MPKRHQTAVRVALPNGKLTEIYVGPGCTVAALKTMLWKKSKKFKLKDKSAYCFLGRDGSIIEIESALLTKAMGLNVLPFVVYTETIYISLVDRAAATKTAEEITFILESPRDRSTPARPAGLPVGKAKQRGGGEASSKGGDGERSVAHVDGSATKPRKKKKKKKPRSKVQRANTTQAIPISKPMGALPVKERDEISNSSGDEAVSNHRPDRAEQLLDIPMNAEAIGGGGSEGESPGTSRIPKETMSPCPPPPQAGADLGTEKGKKEPKRRKKKGKGKKTPKGGENWDRLHLVPVSTLSTNGETMKCADDGTKEGNTSKTFASLSDETDCQEAADASTVTADGALYEPGQGNEDDMKTNGGGVGTRSKRVDKPTKKKADRKKKEKEGTEKSRKGVDDMRVMRLSSEAESGDIEVQAGGRSSTPPQNGRKPLEALGRIDEPITPGRSPKLKKAGSMIRMRSPRNTIPANWKCDEDMLRSSRVPILMHSLSIANSTPVVAHPKADEARSTIKPGTVKKKTKFFKSLSQRDLSTRSPLKGVFPEHDDIATADSAPIGRPVRRKVGPMDKGADAAQGGRVASASPGMALAGKVPATAAVGDPAATVIAAKGASPAKRNAAANSAVADSAADDAEIVPGAGGLPESTASKGMPAKSRKRREQSSENGPAAQVPKIGMESSRKGSKASTKDRKKNSKGKGEKKSAGASEREVSVERREQEVSRREEAVARREKDLAKREAKLAAREADVKRLMEELRT